MLTIEEGAALLNYLYVNTKRPMKYLLEISAVLKYGKDKMLNDINSANIKTSQKRNMINRINKLDNLYNAFLKQKK